MRWAIVVGAILSVAACNRTADPTSPPADSGAATQGEGAQGSGSGPGSAGLGSAGLEGPDEGSDKGSDSGAEGEFADVIGVETTGASGEYTFAVTLRSPDTGCEQYADWWEVLSSDGTLLYRRILGHSHVDEQPFTRSGGPVPVDPSTPLFVRAHMNPGGYGGAVMAGSVGDGFAALGDGVTVPATGVETEAPLPDGCAF